MYPMKHIALDGAHNMRDLGGYPAADGRYTRWNMLYRSDALSDLTQRDWQKLQSLRIRTVIDLRTQEEALAAPVNAPEGVAVMSFSLMGSEVWKGADLQSAGMESLLESMKLNYVKTLFSALPVCAQALGAILQRLEEGGVLFMCSAGKDRTGIIAAVILYLLGVPREDIVADYMVSSTYNEKGINQKMENMPPSFVNMIPDKGLLKELMDSKPQTMIALLEQLDSRNIRKLLDEAGFTAAHQHQLSGVLLAN